MIKLIGKLKQSGIKTAVLSNVIKPHAQIIINHDGYRYFDHVILSYRVHLEKPNSDIYLLAVAKLRVKPQECIFVDDLERNLVPAKKLKMKTVLCNGPRKTIQTINQLLNNR
ncbi:MAG: HAD-IA family hydrolase [bacterium]